MRILVDADACPVIRTVENVAKKNNIEVILLCDTNHELTSNYSEIITVPVGADSADFKIVSMCKKGDIVVTQDYGLAALVLGKGALGIHQSGRLYTDENIDFMLMSRYISKRNREKGVRMHSKKKKRRTNTQNREYNFKDSLVELIENNI